MWSVTRAFARYSPGRLPGRQLEGSPAIERGPAGGQRPPERHWGQLRTFLAVRINQFTGNRVVHVPPSILPGAVRDEVEEDLLAG